jgi:hypothetical protein
MFATSINGWFSNQLYQCNGKSLFIQQKHITKF